MLKNNFIKSASAHSGKKNWRSTFPITLVLQSFGFILHAYAYIYIYKYVRMHECIT